MMDEARFWQIIATSRQRARERPRRRDLDFIEVHEQTVAEILGELSPEDVVGFDERFWDYHRLAYRWDLWAAAYWLHGGCSDDGFIDFRTCLISLGERPFFQVLHDPDSLAELVDRPDTPYMQSEGFQYVAAKVYEAKVGAQMPPHASETPMEPAGNQIDPDDAEVMRRQFPRLVAKFPDMGD